MANEPQFADVPLARIVPKLADEGGYLASESSFACVLCEHGQNVQRGRAKAPRKVHPPSTPIASAPWWPPKLPHPWPPQIPPP